VTATLSLPSFAPAECDPGDGAPSSSGRIFVDGSWREATILKRRSLAAGARIEGPAVVSQMDSTIVLLPGDLGRGDGRLRQPPHRGDSVSVDPVTAEVISNKLGSVADEMSVVLIRSSVSTNIKEREDCSTSVFDALGRLLYQAENIPLHLGSLQGIGSAVGERYGDDIAPGDMFIGNDPYEGGGTHLPDIVLIAPVFQEPAQVGFVANLGHHADFVQRRHHHVFEEGIPIPPLRIRRDGAWIGETLMLLMANF